MKADLRVRRGGQTVPDTGASSVRLRKPPVWAASLSDDWRSFAALDAGHPRSREVALQLLPQLVGQRLHRLDAPKAVHAVMLALSAGRWGPGRGAQAFTTDRVLSAVADVEQTLAETDDVHPSFRAAFDRFRLLAKRALSHTGPTGLYGPLSIYGPIDNHPMSPSSLYPGFQERGTNLSLGDLSAPALVSRTGEFNFEFLAGNPLAFVGPASALQWMLGANGPNGTATFRREAEGGPWRNREGEVVTERNGLPLFELYGESHAQANGSPDAFFGVEGTTSEGQADRFRFRSRKDQWVTIGCSQITAGRRFAVSVFAVKGKKRTLVDRSQGIAGPAGVHARLPAGNYEVVVEQLPPDANAPERNQDSVGRRLGPALEEMRSAFTERFPEQVDTEAEKDPNRYRLVVTGSRGTEETPPPDRVTAAVAIAASEQQEMALATTVASMEATLAGIDLWALTPVGWPLAALTNDDRKDPDAADPMIERFMHAAARLDRLFYGGELANFVRSAGIPSWVTPQTTKNHADS